MNNAHAVTQFRIDLVQNMLQIYRHKILFGFSVIVFKQV